MIELTRDQVLKCLEAGIWCYLLYLKNHSPFVVITELWNEQRMGVWYAPMRRGSAKTPRMVLEFSRYGIDWRLILPSLRGIADWSFLHEDLTKEVVPLLSYRADGFPGCDEQWFSVYHDQLPKVRKEFRPLYLSEMHRKE